jgi:hypothetical protein
MSGGSKIGSENINWLIVFYWVLSVLDEFLYIRASPMDLLVALTLLSGIRVSDTAAVTGCKRSRLNMVFEKKECEQGGNLLIILVQPTS